MHSVAFAAQGRDLVSGAVDGSVLYTRDASPSVAFAALAGGIDTVGFLPDGRVVASDTRLRLRIYAPSGSVLASLRIAARVRTLRMSLDGLRLLTVPNAVAAAALPELWDTTRYRRLAELAAPGQVYSARFVEGG